MKFDFIIGNPPYQEEKDSDNKSFAPPIYDRFMEESFKIADKVELIHPARFLFNIGSTPKEWNRKMLSDEHFKVLLYEPDCKKLFPNQEIKGGIAITYRDSNKYFKPIGVFCKYNELIPLLKCAAPENEKNSLTAIIFTQNRFNLEALYSDYPEYRKIIGSDGKDKRFRNNIFDKIPTFSIQRSEDDDIAVIGVVENKRCWRYINKKYVDTIHENLGYWKVIVPRANGKGLIDDTLSSPTVIGPNQAYTQTFIGIGSFSSELEAQNLLKYIKSKFARSLLATLKADQHNEKDVWRMIPLQDFSAKSDINWNVSIGKIDEQLYTKYSVDSKVIDFIETHVKEMD